MLNLKPHLLIVEDEKPLREGLRFNFEAEDFSVHVSANGDDAFEYIEKYHEKLDLIVLDLMLPGLDGYEVLQKTRAKVEHLPILVLSAKNDEASRVRAFELGADDFVAKPFSLLELILRVTRLLKYQERLVDKDKSELQTAVATMGQATVFFENLTLTCQGQTHRISPTEALLMKVFLDHPGKILTRQELLKQVWNYEPTLETRTVDVFVGKIRKFIEPDPAQPCYLRSIRTQGYCYTATGEPSSGLALRSS
jgi:DNA-binding response OmpR family regulator